MKRMKRMKLKQIFCWHKWLVVESGTLTASLQELTGITSENDLNIYIGTYSIQKCMKCRLKTEKQEIPRTFLYLLSGRNANIQRYKAVHQEPI